ncbi:MAG: hypothetical protein K9N52_10410 [Verrucomicrobia bacterium]|nr:hypothetical protein [Verrucomicrobiota bacterium]
MKFILLFVSVLLISGCKPSDAKIREQITGTWARDDTFEMTLTKDGGFISQWKSTTNNLTYYGTWKIQDGDIVSVLTNFNAHGNTNVAPLGVNHHKIMQIDSNDLVLSNEGQTVSLKRKR